MSSDSFSTDSPYAGLASRIRPGGSADAQAIAAQRASQPPRVRVALARGILPLRLLTEPCQVFVDGASVGRMSSRDKVEAVVAPGKHTLQVRSGWLRSNAVELGLGNGDIAQFVCTGHSSALDLMFGMFLIYATLIPQRFFRLSSFRP